MKRSTIGLDRSIGRTLTEKAAGGASGILSARRGKLRRVFCLDSGWLVFAASNVLEEQFPEVLVRDGILSPSERVRAVEEASSHGLKIVQVLMAEKHPPPEALRRAFEGHVRELLAATLEWTDGEMSFEDGVPRLDGEITVKLSPVPIVIAHAWSYPPLVDAVRARIGPADVRPERSERAETLAGRIEFGPTAGFLLAACDGTLTVGELVGRSPSGEEETLRALHGLLLAGILEPAGAVSSQDSVTAGKDLPITREECEARLSLPSEADHYRVLGIEREARREQVRDAYYSLARRFHPDRFRAGALQDLLPRFEDFFSRVTEAYNTLHDPDNRSEYDRQMAESTADADAGKLSEPAHLARQNFLRGRALARERRLNDAVKFLENAIRLDEGQADYHLELGLVLATNPRRRDEAEQLILRALEMAPTKTAGYVALGQMYQRAGRTGDAVRMFREAVRWDPDHTEARAILAGMGVAAEG